MKKNISVLASAAFLCALLLCGCKGKTNVVVDGELADTAFEGQQVYLVAISDTRDTIDSTLVTNGKFAFDIKLAKPAMGHVFTKDKEYGGYLVLENGTVSIDIVGHRLSGTPLNDSLSAYFIDDAKRKELSGACEQCLSNYYAASTDAQRKEALDAYYEADSLLTEYSRAKYLEGYKFNAHNIFGAYLVYSYLQENYEMDYQGFEDLLADADEVVTTFKPIQDIRTRLFHEFNTSEGKHFTDFEGVNFATGENVTLGAMLDTSKVTLVDFWASWCGPCRQEISENLVRLYKEYKDKGLDIIGVDVWDKTPDHKTAVENLGIEYPQLIDTTRNATDLYGVIGIPTILLIDKDGTIVRRGIRGEEIEKAVVELLNR